MVMIGHHRRCCYCCFFLLLSRYDRIVLLLLLLSSLDWIDCTSLSRLSKHRQYDDSVSVFAQHNANNYRRHMRKRNNYSVSEYKILNDCGKIRNLQANHEEELEQFDIPVNDQDDEEEICKVVEQCRLCTGTDKDKIPECTKTGRIETRRCGPKRSFGV